ncbi:putative SNAP25 homologous protein SNAP30 [Phalaenopsis equestris]|uniref:putative SNAP25 homologous protein SNAP30 n=1 Tax=Phalaenopsis equestris TaxID=78828 RepID=UPI0009E4588B|nr:putative SNAP25 homologous protein SNAP30 [Phalaenopsis equestris]
MTHLYQHVKHSVDTSMSKIRSSKAPKIKVYELPGSVFFRTYPFNPYMKKSHRSTVASTTPSTNQSHNNSPDAKDTSSPLYSTLADGNIGCMNEFRAVNNFENQSVQELEKYCVHKAEETTQTINGCMKVAEEIRVVSSRTLSSIHQQGEQIIRTHSTTVTIDHELNRGEKILGSLGGVFSRTWKPKKSREIKGPVLSNDNLLLKKRTNMEQRTKLGLNAIRSRSNPRHPSSALERVEMEKMKQDDALSNLSDLLSELKAMAIGIGSEVERQNKALDHMQDDVEELNVRVRGANLRARYLLGR